MGAPAWQDPPEPKAAGKRLRTAPAICAKPLQAQRPSISEGSHTGLTAKSSEVPLVRRKRQRWVRSASDPFGGEGQLDGCDRRKDLASVENDFGFANLDVENVMEPSMRCFEGLAEALLLR